MAEIIRDENGDLILRSDWWPEDIEQQAEDMGVTLTSEQVEKVMHLIARTHDACVGINWDVIESAIDHVMGDN
jgi:hypothetical protein